MTESPPEGWYSNSSGQQRFWDGSSWWEYNDAIASPAGSAPDRLRRGAASKPEATPAVSLARLAHGFISKPREQSPMLITGIVAAVGIVIGSTGSWYLVGPYSTGGQGRSTATLLIGLAAIAALLAVFLWPKGQSEKWTLPLAGFALMSGLTVFVVAVGYIVQIYRYWDSPENKIPFEFQVYPQPGWGLWMVTFASVALAVPAALTLRNLVRTSSLDPNTNWVTYWKITGFVVATVVVIVGTIYPLTQSL